MTINTTRLEDLTRDDFAVAGIDPEWVTLHTTRDQREWRITDPDDLTMIALAPVIDMDDGGSDEADLGWGADIKDRWSDQDPWDVLNTIFEQDPRALLAQIAALLGYTTPTTTEPERSPPVESAAAEHDIQLAIGDRIERIIGPFRSVWTVVEIIPAGAALAFTGEPVTFVGYGRTLNAPNGEPLTRDPAHDFIGRAHWFSAHKLDHDDQGA